MFLPAGDCRMIRFQPSALLLMAALILLLPLDWLLAALLAAALHELGHLAAIKAFGRHPVFLSVGMLGATIHTGPLTNRAEFLCAAAGPWASLMLLLLCRLFPKLALCGLLQGLFNLIPLYPLDGGRMLFCLLRWCCPRRAERICSIVQRLVLFGFLALLLLAGIRGKSGFVLFLFCITVLSRLLLSKIPCKSV